MMAPSAGFVPKPSVSSRGLDVDASFRSPGVVLCVLSIAAARWIEPLDAVSTTLVIYEFITRGPIGENDEFIELRNISGVPLSLNGWTVLGSNGSGVTEVRANLSSVTLGPGCGYLLTNSNTNGYSGFVPGDQTYGVGITDDGGLALQAPGGAIVDQVGMSAGSAYGEGTRLASFGSANSSRSYQRLGPDSDDNAANFRMISPAEPNNSAGCSSPTGTGTASPSVVAPGGNVLLTIAVTPANNPTSTGIGVVADLSSIGGMSTQPLFDTGTFGDQVASDNTFSLLTSIDATATTGPRILIFTITDAQSRSTTGTINLTLQATTSTDPSGAGSTQPAPAVSVGSALTIQVGVTPGSLGGRRERVSHATALITEDLVNAILPSLSDNCVPDCRCLQLWRPRRHSRDVRDRSHDVRGQAIARYSR